MKITYCCNSGFMIEQDRRLLVFDYINGFGLKSPVTPQFLQGFDSVYVFASHAHSDHFDPVVLKWNEWNSRLTYLFSEDIRSRIGRKTASNRSFLFPGGIWNDSDISVTAYGSTDQGVSFHVNTEGVSIFHAGDLNDWHWKSESTPKEIADMKKSFDDILDSIEKGAGRLDIAMFPVDPRMGQDFHAGADTFIERFNPVFFIPMHFRKDYGAVDTFIAKHPDKVKSIWRIQSTGQTIGFNL